MMNSPACFSIFPSRLGLLAISSGPNAHFFYTFASKNHEASRFFHGGIKHNQILHKRWGRKKPIKPKVIFIEPLPIASPFFMQHLWSRMSWSVFVIEDICWTSYRIFATLEQQVDTFSFRNVYVSTSARITCLLIDIQFRTNKLPSLECLSGEVR